MRPDIAEIADHLSHLRRYARAMSGNRSLGDRFAERALVTVLNDSLALKEEDCDLRIALFRALQDARRTDAHALDDDTQSAILTRAHRHLSRLTPGSREAFLLSAFEEFSHQEIASILRLSPQDVDGLITIARADLSNMISGRVLVIEDELAVATDIAKLVTDMGHSVIGPAPTQEDALDLIETEEPDLILSDIQLAQGGSGIKTVTTILRSYPMTPVIFITGFPERLLTGRGPEPAFLVTKPYAPDQVGRQPGHVLCLIVRQSSGGD